MSATLVNEYRSELDRLRSASRSLRESVVREAFKDLFKRWDRQAGLVFLAEHEYLTPRGERRYLDGALVHTMRVPFGYREAKDTGDDLDAEIAKKFAAGYPRDNILFEDTRTAVLFQHGREVSPRVAMDDTAALTGLLERFFAYERPEVADFNKAVRQFAADLPQVLAALRDIIAEKRAASRAFSQAEDAFLLHAREAINPAVTWCSTSTKRSARATPRWRGLFNTYRFADHKEAMIGLLARVVRAGVETVGVTEAMRALPRDA